jgi:hypothetical protein
MLVVWDIRRKGGFAEWITSFVKPATAWRRFRRDGRQTHSPVPLSTTRRASRRSRTSSSPLRPRPQRRAARQSRPALRGLATRWSNRVRRVSDRGRTLLDRCGAAASSDSGGHAATACRLGRRPLCLSTSHFRLADAGVPKQPLFDLCRETARVLRRRGWWPSPSGIALATSCFASAVVCVASPPKRQRCGPGLADRSSQTKQRPRGASLVIPWITRAARPGAVGLYGVCDSMPPGGVATICSLTGTWITGSSPTLVMRLSVRPAAATSASRRIPAAPRTGRSRR